MRKLVRLETVYLYYSVDISDELAELYEKDEDKFWEKAEEDYLEDEMEIVREEDGDIDYYIE